MAGEVISGKDYIDYLRENNSDVDIHRECRRLIEEARKDPSSKEMEVYYSHQVVYEKQGNYRLFQVRIHVYPRKGQDGQATVVGANEIIEGEDIDKFFRSGDETYDTAEKMKSMIVSKR